MPTSEQKPADMQSIVGEIARLIDDLTACAGPDNEADLEQWLRQNYPAVRKLSDGSYAALCPLLFTTSVLLGCDRWGWGKRFCFESAARARVVFEALETEDDEPTGYIARYIA